MGVRKPQRPTVAEQSALDALQAELDAERLAHLATRHRLEREIAVLQARLVEIEAELARSEAHTRELEARLQARAK